METINEMQAPQRGKSTKTLVTQLLIWLVIAVFLGLGAFFFTKNFIEKWPITGSSMNATITTGDNVLVFKTKKVKYDDVIIFYSDALRENLVKRVIGKAGDVIRVEKDDENHCHIYRNGELLSEDKIFEPMIVSYGFTPGETIVPEGKIYFLGDNRNHSTDSSEGHLCDVDKIVGIAFVRIKSDGSFNFIN